MRHEFTTLAAMVVMGFAGASVSADALLTSQTRYVRATAGDAFDTATHQVNAPGYGLFDDSTSITFFSDLGSGGGTANATQTSFVHPQLITASGQGDGTGGGGVGTGYATGLSVLQVTFEALTPTPYTLEGTIRADEFFSHAWARLSGPGGMLVDEQIGEFLGSWATVDFTGVDAYSGVLAPGTYTLDLRASGSGVNDSSLALFDVRLTIPEPVTAWLMLAGLPLALRRSA
jgi:hypothetical protein